MLDIQRVYSWKFWNSSFAKCCFDVFSCQAHTSCHVFKLGI